MNKKNFDYLQENVIVNKLCSQCGTCVGVCGRDSIGFMSNIDYTPVWKNKNSCTNCGLCSRCCPGLGYPLHDVSKSEKLQYDKDLGFYSGVFTGHANDVSIREKASSGGVVTAILCYLIETKKVDGVIVVQNTKSLLEGYAEVVTTGNKDEIISAAQSKYIQVPVGKMIKEILNKPGKYAIVGLPCHLAGLERAMTNIPKLKEKIYLKLGLFCGYTYTGKSVGRLFDYMGLDRSKVERIIGWREAGLPGNFQVLLKSGEKCSISFKDEHSIDVTFYSQERCLLCMDCLSEYSDISFGDVGGWRKKDTLMISRSNAGNELLGEMAAQGVLELTPLTMKETFNQTVIPFMLSEKRDKTQLRLDFLQKRNKPKPFWDVHGKPMGLIKQFETRIIHALQNHYRRAEIEQKIAQKPKRLIKIGSLLYLGISSNPILVFLKKVEGRIRKDKGYRR